MNEQSIQQINEAHQGEILPFFGQERLLDAQEKGPLNNSKYLKAKEQNHLLTRSKVIDAVLTKHRLDALVAPTGGITWLIDWINGDMPGGPETAFLAAVAGYPHITVPAGNIHGIPIGLSFISTAWQEPLLIRLAYSFEQASRRRKSPEYLPTLEQPKS